LIRYISILFTGTGAFIQRFQRATETRSEKRIACSFRSIRAKTKHK